jgi:hypothetical protein
VYERVQDHIYKSKSEPNRPLYAAFNKYGLDNFSLEILGEYASGLLEQKEEEFIIKFNSFGASGYNATRGGDGTRYLKISDEEVISTYNKIKIVKETARVLGIDAQTVTNILNKNNIKPLTSKEAMLRKSKKVSFNNKTFEHAQDCAQYLLDNEIIQSSAKIRSIANKIQEVCNGSKQKYMGLTFSYA